MQNNFGLADAPALGGGFPRRNGDVEPLDVLREIAQFYGMFVQINDKWGFVHRPIHDYLAAQHSVRNGFFAEQLTGDSFALDSRTAYAAVLSDHTTEALLKILNRHDQQAVVRTVEEILLNEPSFDVAEGLARNGAIHKLPAN